MFEPEYLVWVSQIQEVANILTAGNLPRLSDVILIIKGITRKCEYMERCREHALLNYHFSLNHRASLLRVWFLAEKSEFQKII